MNYRNFATIVTVAYRPGASTPRELDARVDVAWRRDLAGSWCRARKTSGVVFRRNDNQGSQLLRTELRSWASALALYKIKPEVARCRK